VIVVQFAKDNLELEKRVLTFITNESSRKSGSGW